MKLKYYNDYKNKEVVIKELSSTEGEKYYSEIREHINLELSQVILTEEIMLDLIVALISVKKFSICNIHSEDESFNNKIKELAEQASIDRDFNINILHEIHKREFSELNNVEMAKENSTIKLSSNGIIQLEGEALDKKDIQELSIFVKEYLFGKLFH